MALTRDWAHAFVLVRSHRGTIVSSINGGSRFGATTQGQASAGKRKTGRTATAELEKAREEGKDRQLGTEIREGGLQNETRRGSFSHERRFLFHFIRKRNTKTSVPSIPFTCTRLSRVCLSIEIRNIMSSLVLHVQR